ncbi:MAG TPA: FAD:protein FMN transferase [Polyangiaceae bacterium]|nr:FAD:protein FMN transferase [Polyangiaceae bacterium]
MTGSAKRRRSSWRNTDKFAIFAAPWLLLACNRPTTDKTPELSDAAFHVPTASSTRSAPNGLSAAASASAPLGAITQPPVTPAPLEKVDFQDVAMGTKVHFIAYTNAQVDSLEVRSAMTRALAEMQRLEALLSEWRDDSEVGQINSHPEQWVHVGPETFAVISRGLSAGKASGGAFDITFQAMSDVWKFGSAADATPKVPSKAEIEQRRRLVDYRTVELDPSAQAVRLPKAHKIGLGGIAKGFIVDRAADVLKRAGVQAFLVQAGGDLYGAGRKPDGSPWLSGIMDPRGPEGSSFATIELTDHAFSTAGDYARSYVIGKRRYHHIIDPHTGYPATASRSVTVWADDATTADAIDDAVFIMGPQAGLELVEATPGVGAVIVDKNNKVWVSQRLQGKVHLTSQPSDGI